jgi:hypothetical protein
MTAAGEPNMVGLRTFQNSQEQRVKLVIASQRVGAKRRPMTGSAKQSILSLCGMMDCFLSLCGMMDCFAALAMTTKYASTIPRRGSRPSRA